MVNVIVDQRALGFANGFFNGMKLLGEIKAGAPFIEHRDDPAQMALGPLQPLDDIRMGFVRMLA